MAENSLVEAATSLRELLDTEHFGQSLEDDQFLLNFTSQMRRLHAEWQWFDNESWPLREQLLHQPETFEQAVSRVSLTGDMFSMVTQELVLRGMNVPASTPELRELSFERLNELLEEQRLNFLASIDQLLELSTKD